MAAKKSVKRPLTVGNKVLIRTVTYFQVGVVEDIGEQEILLNQASWVASTGRFNECLKTGKIEEAEPFADGMCEVGRGAIVDVANWNHPLPTDVI